MICLKIEMDKENTNKQNRKLGVGEGLYQRNIIRNATRIQGSGVSLYVPSRWQKYTIKLLHVIE